MLRRNRICCWFFFGVFATKTSRDSGFSGLSPQKARGELGSASSPEKRSRTGPRGILLPSGEPHQEIIYRPWAPRFRYRVRAPFVGSYALPRTLRRDSRSRRSRPSAEDRRFFPRSEAPRPWRRGTERLRPRAPDRATRGRGPYSHGRTPRALPARLRDSHPRRSAPLRGGGR